MATAVTTAAANANIPAAIQSPNPGARVPCDPDGRLEPKSLYFATNRKAPAHMNKPERYCSVLCSIYNKYACLL